MPNNSDKARVKIALVEKYTRKLNASGSLTKKKWCRNKITAYRRQAKQISGS
jgi:hypothetical protein